MPEVKPNVMSDSLAIFQRDQFFAFSYDLGK